MSSMSYSNVGKCWQREMIEGLQIYYLLLFSRVFKGIALRAKVKKERFYTQVTIRQIV